VAVVTDVEWIKVAMRIFGLLIHYHCFSTSQADTAREWIGA